MNIDNELDEIFADPILDLNERERALFDIPADMQPAASRRKQADYVAKYRPCADFDRYRSRFQLIYTELKHGKRTLVKVSKTSNLQAGRYYVLEGVMLYLESIADTYTDQGNGLKNGRTRCILENGMETDILLQTLRKNVVGNGYGITETEEQTDARFMNNNDMGEHDRATGYIYVLSSCSTNPQIAGVENLYKIGFTTSTVEERIANAEKEPTYLMAPVRVEATYSILNMNSHTFEALIHQVLDAAQMQITVTDERGVDFHPKEWFVVPLPVIETIMLKIMNGSITHYTYNPEMQCLERMIEKRESTFDVSGCKVLTLIIKKCYFDEIISGTKTIEYRELKQTTLKKYTYIDETDGKRYLRWYDMLRLYVGYGKDRESALVEVTDITYSNGTVEYHLGRVLEHVKAY